MYIHPSIYFIAKTTQIYPLYVHTIRPKIIINEKNSPQPSLNLSQIDSIKAKKQKSQKKKNFGSMTTNLICRVRAWSLIFSILLPPPPSPTLGYDSTKYAIIKGWNEGKEICPPPAPSP